MTRVENATATTVQHFRERLNTLEHDGQRFARKLVDEVEQRIPDSSKRAIDDLLERARRTRDGIERRVDEGLDRTLGALNIPTRGQIEQLDRRLSDLSKRVNALSKSRPVVKKPSAPRGKRTARVAS